MANLKKILSITAPIIITVMMITVVKMSLYELHEGALANSLKFTEVTVLTAVLLIKIAVLTTFLFYQRNNRRSILFLIFVILDIPGSALIVTEAGGIIWMSVLLLIQTSVITLANSVKTRPKVLTDISIEFDRYKKSRTPLVKGKGSQHLGPSPLIWAEEIF